MSSKLENLMQSLGNPGRSQVLTIAVVITIQFMTIATNFSFIFTTFIPDHTCKLPGNWSWPKNISIPLEINNDGEEVYEKCSMYVNPENHSQGTTACEFGYEYKENDALQSIARQWDLVCDKHYLSSVYQSVFFAGVFFGGFVGGYSSDTFGRLPTYVLGIIVRLGLNVAIYFVTDFIGLLSLVFLDGAMQQVISNLSIVIMYETLVTKYRTMVGIILACTVSISTTMAACTTLFTTNFKEYVLAMIAPLTVPLALIWLVPETLRWLLSTGQVTTASKNLKRIAKCNRVSLPQETDVELKQISEDIRAEMRDGNKETIWEMMRKSQLRKITIILCCSSIVGQISSYGQVMSLRIIHSNVFMTSLVMGILDLLFRPLAYCMLTRLGRVKTLFLSKVIVGVSNLLCCVFVSFSAERMTDPFTILGLVSSFIGRYGIGLFWCTYPIYTAEIFPTTIRSTMVGIAYACGRLGYFLIPGIVLLGDLAWKQFPFLVFGLSTLLVAFFTLRLPENADIPMPDTITEMLDLANSKKKKLTKEQHMYEAVVTTEKL